MKAVGGEQIMSYPIKVQALCERCKYHFDNWCLKRECSLCPKNDGEICLCLTVKKDEPCNMYEEAGESGNE